jgi:hypothetical protein
LSLVGKLICNTTPPLPEALSCRCLALGGTGGVEAHPEARASIHRIWKRGRTRMTPLVQLGSRDEDIYARQGSQDTTTEDTYLMFHFAALAQPLAIPQANADLLGRTKPRRR